MIMPVTPAPEIRCFQSPNRYVQGPGTFNSLYETVAIFGDSAFAIIDTALYDEYEKKIAEQFSKQKMTISSAKFEGEVDQDTLDNLNAQVKALEKIPAFIIGMGGGKTCDIAKAVANDFNTKVIIMPTALSTDAPTSSHSVFYNKDGSHYIKRHRRNPDYVILDTNISILAPLTTFISGMGDAMATYWEAMASYANTDVCYAGGSKYCSTQTGRAIAELSYKTLIQNGRQAYMDAKQHVRSAAYEEIAEANTLLSGLGFENNRCSIAHGLQGVLHLLPAKPLLHGQGVGYSLLVQLLVEVAGGIPGRREVFEEIFAWSKDVGLPLCFADLGITEDRDKHIAETARIAIGASYLLKNEPFEVNEKMLRDAIFELEDYAARHR